MPRVTLGTKAKAQAASEEANEALVMMVLARLRKDGVTQKALAEKVGVSTVTMCKRLKAPEHFTLGELRRLREAVGMTPSEIARCV